MRLNKIPLHRYLLGLILVSSLLLLVKSGKLNQPWKAPRPRPPPVLMRVHPSKAPEMVGRVSVGSKGGRRLVRFDMRRRDMVLNQIELPVQPDQEPEELHLADDITDPPIFTNADFVALARTFRTLSLKEHKRKRRHPSETQSMDRQPQNKPCLIPVQIVDS